MSIVYAPAMSSTPRVNVSSFPSFLYINIPTDIRKQFVEKTYELDDKAIPSIVLNGNTKYTMLTTRGNSRRFGVDGMNDICSIGCCGRMCTGAVAVVLFLIIYGMTLSFSTDGNYYTDKQKYIYYIMAPILVLLYVPLVLCFFYVVPGQYVQGQIHQVTQKYLFEEISRILDDLKEVSELLALEKVGQKAYLCEKIRQWNDIP